MTKKREKRVNKYFGWKGPFRDTKPPFKLRMYHRATRTPIDCVKFEPYSLAFDMEVNRINELYAGKAAKPGTLGMLIEKYRASPVFKGHSDRTKADYQKCFDWLKAIDDTPLDRFSRGFVARIRDRAHEQHKFHFANYVRTVLSIIFDWGMEYEYVKENPVKHVSLAARPKNLPAANRPWTDAERETVLAALPAHMVLPISLMMFYALDPQDALGLPKTSMTAAGIDTRRGKTGEAIYLPLFGPVSSALAAAPEHDADTLCANSRGKAWTYNGFSTNWDRFKKTLEKDGLVQPGLTLKGLRHTVATILAEMGKDSGTIQLVLGHATEAMAKHYSKRADKRKQAAAAVADFGVELNERKMNVVKSRG